MLVLTRRVGEKIMIGDDIELIVFAIDRNQVKMGFKAPKNVRILRHELLERMKKKESKNVE